MDTGFITWPIRVGNCLSEPMQTNSGAIQGGCIGLVLFLLHTNSVINMCTQINQIKSSQLFARIKENKQGN